MTSLAGRLGPAALSTPLLILALLVLAAGCDKDKAPNGGAPETPEASSAGASTDAAAAGKSAAKATTVADKSATAGVAPVGQTDDKPAVKASTPSTTPVAVPSTNPAGSQVQYKRPEPAKAETTLAATALILPADIPQVALLQSDLATATEALKTLARLHWRTPVKGLGAQSSVAMSLGSNRVAVAGRKATVGLNRTDGKLTWTEPRGATSVDVVKDRLVLSSPTRVLNIVSGAPLWTAPLVSAECGALIGGNYLAFYDITGEDDYEREDDWAEGETRDSVAVYSLKGFKRRTDISGIVGKMRCPTGGSLGFYAGQQFVSGRANKLAWNVAWEAANIAEGDPDVTVERGRQLVTIRATPPTISTFHVNDGALQWTQPLPKGLDTEGKVTEATAVGDAIVVPGSVAVGTETKSVLYALRRDSGQPLWHRHMRHGAWGLATSNDGLWMWSEGTLHLLNPASGELAWSVRMDGAIVGITSRKSRLYVALSPPAAAASDDAVVVAFTPKLPADYSADLPSLPMPAWIPPRAESSKAGSTTTNSPGVDAVCGDITSDARVAPSSIALTDAGLPLIAGRHPHFRSARLAAVTHRGRTVWDGALSGDGEFNWVFARSGGPTVLVGGTRSRTANDDGVQLLGLDASTLQPAWERIHHHGVGFRDVVAAHMATDGSLSLGVKTGRKSFVARHDATGKLKWNKRLPRRRDRLLAVRGTTDGMLEVLLSGPAPKKGRQGVRYVVGYKKPRRTTKYASAVSPLAAAFDVAAIGASDATKEAGAESANVWWVSPMADGKGWQVRLLDSEGKTLLEANLAGASGKIVGTHVDSIGLYLLERQPGPPGMLWHIPRTGPAMGVAVPSTAIPDAWVADADGFHIAGHDDAKRLKLLSIDRRGRLRCPKAKP